MQLLSLSDRPGCRGTASVTADEGNVITREAVLRQQLADFHLDEIEQFSVVNEVDTC
jgi:hypothetical protein